MIEGLRKQLGEVRENEPLAPYTTFQIGGPARYFFAAHTTEDVERAVQVALQCQMPFFVLSGGSNILVSDAGFAGLVILNTIKGLQWRIADDSVTVVAGAGENWDALVAQCVGKNLVGVECLSGIPGAVGAAPVQNIGAYGQSVDSVIEKVEAVDATTGACRVFSRAQCEFGYRTSIFKQAQGRYIITRVTFKLNVHGEPRVAYHDLQQYFAGKTPTLAQVRQAVIEIRARKGYVIMPEYECYKTAGSFFMNPIISAEQFEKVCSVVLREANGGCADPWFWKLADEQVKVSAACLLQSAGFSKGYRRGAVGISPKHALSIVNFAQATAREVLALAQAIKVRVREKFGIELQEEVQLVGVAESVVVSSQQLRRVL